MEDLHVTPNMDQLRRRRAEAAQAAQIANEQLVNAEARIARMEPLYFAARAFCAWFYSEGRDGLEGARLQHLMMRAHRESTSETRGGGVVTFDQRTPLQLRRALGDAENALANERAKVERLQAQIERLEQVTAGDGARIFALQAEVVRLQVQIELGAAEAYEEGYNAGFDDGIGAPEVSS